MSNFFEKNLIFDQIAGYQWFELKNVDNYCSKVAQFLLTLYRG